MVTTSQEITHTSTPPNGALTRYKRILIATDFTEASQWAFREAVQLAVSLDAHLDVMHVQPDIAGQALIAPAVMPQALPPAAVDQQFSIIEGQREELEARLANLVAPYRGQVSVSTHSKIGDPAQHMLEASEEVDLIVMGAHQRSALQELLHGSVERTVTKRAKCPVLLVPAHPEASA